MKILIYPLYFVLYSPFSVLYSLNPTPAPRHVTCMKIFVAGKQIDATSYKNLRFLDYAGFPIVNTTEEFKVTLDTVSGYIIYQDFATFVPKISIVNEKDTMTISLPTYYTYIDNIPFQSGKFTIPSMGATKMWNDCFVDAIHTNKKIAFLEDQPVKNFSIKDWRVVKEK